MPVIRCPNGKYRIGSGPCVYTSKAAAVRAYQAYLAKKSSEVKGVTLLKMRARLKHARRQAKLK